MNFFEKMIHFIRGFRQLKNLGYVEALMQLAAFIHQHEFEVKESGRYRITIGYDLERKAPTISIDKTF